MINIGFISIPSFFILISALTVLALYLTVRRSRMLYVDEMFTLDLAFVLILSGIVGARLTHVAFENWEYYRSQPIKILYFWEGGFVFFGGFIFSFFCGILFLVVLDKQVYLKLYMRLFTPILSLCYALGRVGCFLEGCCYGKFCELPWAVNQRHPTQIYSLVWELGVFTFLLGYESKNKKLLEQRPERLFFIWLLLHSTGRGLIEFLRDDFRGNWPIISMATWLSLFFIGIALAYFYRYRFKW